MGENAERKQKAKDQSSPCQRIILKLLLIYKEKQQLIDSGKGKNRIYVKEKVEREEGKL